MCINLKSVEGKIKIVGTIRTFKKNEEEERIKEKLYSEKKRILL